MSVSLRALSVQGLQTPPRRSPCGSHPSSAHPAKPPLRHRLQPCRAFHEPAHGPDETPMDRVVRNFDDRDHMFPVADLLRLVQQYKHDQRFHLLMPWMLALETKLEFLTDSEQDVRSAETLAQRRAAVRDAVNTARGFRRHLDAFDSFLTDEPEVFEDALVAADAAFDRRIHELQKLAYQAPQPQPGTAPSDLHAPAQLSALPLRGGPGGLVRRWREQMKAQLDRYVEIRSEAPPVDYEPLAEIRKQVEDEPR